MSDRKLMRKRLAGPTVCGREGRGYSDVVTPQPDANDPYVRLGVTRSASAREIKAAYRALARELHPDRNPDANAADQFHRITEAYTQLLEWANNGGGSGADAVGDPKSVSDEMIMVLLAEPKVGSVADFFSAVVQVSVGDTSAAPAPGVICLGETGVAFVYRLSQDQLLRRPEQAVVPIAYADIVSITIESPDPAASSATLTATGDRSMVIHTSRSNLATLRTARVRYQADNADLPEPPKQSFWAKVRGFGRGHD